MKKVSIIFGTRPEAIKLAPLILLMRAHPEIKPHVCVTAQHRELLDQVLDVFGISPDVDLQLMQENQTLSDFTARAVTALDGYVREHQPDLVIVQGDTTTVFVAALAAFYHKARVGHVEAGLRTWNRYAPFPEEINRVLTSRLADYHFAPTTRAAKNLAREGVPEESVYVTGNTVIDALQIAAEKVRKEPPEVPGLPKDILAAGSNRPLVLITGHRRESFGKGFESICNAVSALADRFKDTLFVYPVHLNPNVREPVFRILSGRENIRLIEPLSYLPFVALMDRCAVILTDSGGIQEEAPSLGKPVLVMRELTERPEAVEAGCARLVGANEDRIIEWVARLLTDEAAYAEMAHKANPYGDGKASERILKIIEET